MVQPLGVVRKYLAFLIDDLGFELAESQRFAGYVEVAVRSGDLRVKVTYDRGSYEFSVGSAASQRLFDLVLVRREMEPNWQPDIPVYPDLKNWEERSRKLEKEMSQFLKDRFDQICELFSPANFCRTETALDELAKKRLRERFGAR